MTTTSINISTSQQMHRLQFVIVVASTFQDLSLAPFFFPSRRDRSEKKKGSQPVHGRRMVSSLSLSLSLTHTHTHTCLSFVGLDWFGLLPLQKTVICPVDNNSLLAPLSSFSSNRSARPSNGRNRTDKTKRTAHRDIHTYMYVYIVGIMFHTE